MTTQATAPRRRQAQGGPHLGVLGIVFAALFLVGLVLATIMAGGKPYPAPFGDAADIVAYFREHRHAVHVGGAFQFGAAVRLAIYSATVSARLQQLGIR